MKDWLANWLTGGKLRRLEQEARNAEEWVKYMEGVRDVLATELDWALSQCVNHHRDCDSLKAHAVRLYEQRRETIAEANDAVVAFAEGLDRVVNAIPTLLRRYDAKSVEATALRHEVERQRGVIFALREKPKPPRRGSQRRRESRSGRRRH